MSHRHAIAIIACLTVMTLLAAPARGGPTRVLSVYDCLSAARENDLGSQLAARRVDAARFGRGATAATAWPTVHLNANGLYAPSTRRFGYDPAVTDQGQIISLLTLEQPLYDGGRRRASLARADLDIAAAANAQGLAGADFDFLVMQSIVGVLRAQSEVTLREAAVSDLSGYVDVVRMLRAGGTVPTTDLLRANVDLANAQIAASQAREGLSQGKLSLAQLMGNLEDTNFVLAGSLAEPLLFDMEPPPAAPPRLDTTNCLDLRAAWLSYRQSLADVRQTERQRWPTLSLVADVGYLSSRANWIAPSSERYNCAGYSIGVTFELPLFDRGSNHHQVQQRKAEAQADSIQVVLLRQQQETQLRRIHSALSALSGQLDTIRISIQTAEQNYLMIKAKYAAAQAPASEVLTARQLITDTELSELEDLTSSQVLRAEWKRLVAGVR